MLFMAMLTLYYYLPFFFLNVVLVLSFFTCVVIFLLFNFDLVSVCVCDFKNSDFKTCDLKTQFLKTHLLNCKNCGLAFKIVL